MSQRVDWSIPLSSGGLPVFVHTHIMPDSHWAIFMILCMAALMEDAHLHEPLLVDGDDKHVSLHILHMFILQYCREAYMQPSCA